MDYKTWSQESGIGPNNVSFHHSGVMHPEAHSMSKSLSWTCWRGCIEIGANSIIDCPVRSFNIFANVRVFLGQGIAVSQDKRRRGKTRARSAR